MEPKSFRHTKVTIRLHLLALCTDCLSHIFRFMRVQEIRRLSILSKRIHNDVACQSVRRVEKIDLRKATTTVRKNSLTILQRHCHNLSRFHSLLDCPKEIGGVLQHCHNLERVTLTINTPYFSPKDESRIVSLLGNLSSLNSLVLENFLNVDLNSLSNCTRLVHLEIRAYITRVVQIKDLHSVLHRLEVLKLFSCNGDLGSQFQMCLSRHGQLLNLRTLVFHRCQVVNDFCSVLPRLAPNLQKFGMYPWLNDEGVAKLAQGNLNLSRLFISGPHITTRTIGLLTNGRVFPKLSHLAVSKSMWNDLNLFRGQRPQCKIVAS